MIQSNAIMLGWNRAVPGRETISGELFAHTTSFLEKQRTTSNIESWEPVFLASHGGDLNGYFMIKGTHAQLDTLSCNDEWVDIVLRAGQCLTNVGVIQCYTGNVVSDLMSRWTKTIPSR